MKKNEIVRPRFFAIIATFLIAATAWAGSQTSTRKVDLIGRVSCARCGPWEPLHKGYTRLTWALHSIGEGDDIVLVVGNDTYKLQGGKLELLKFMEAKAIVSGELEGRTLTVQTIGPVSKVR